MAKTGAVLLLLACLSVGSLGHPEDGKEAGGEVQEQGQGASGLEQDTSGHWQQGAHGKGFKQEEAKPSRRKYKKKVHKPYPGVEKVPSEVEVSVERPYPVYIPQPYPVYIERDVQVQIKESAPPTKKMAYSLDVQKPYAIYVERRIPYTVEKRMPYKIKVPVEQAYPLPVALEKDAPYQVERVIRYPLKVPSEEPLPYVFEKPYSLLPGKKVVYEAQSAGGGQEGRAAKLQMAEGGRVVPVREEPEEGAGEESYLPYRPNVFRDDGEVVSATVQVKDPKEEEAALSVPTSYSMSSMKAHGQEISYSTNVEHY